MTMEQATSLDVADRLDILDLYARYSVLFDTGQAEAWADLFTPDGTFLIVGGPSLYGRGELAPFAERRYQDTPGIRHIVSNVIVEPAADGARGSAYVVVLGGVDDGTETQILTLGGYDDRLARTEAGWRFESRTYCAWTNPAKANGRLFGISL
ncbi:MAG TPA: nuclear transport factor 2 family protein [Acidimicrobiia bacterium]|jgi:hypothetical protein